MNLQVFQYQNSPIAFDFNGEVMVNATQMAKAFGKQPADFIRLAQTQEFTEALAARYGKSHIDFLKVVKGGQSGQGTWMHQKLALKFAAWLSPDFELWVYDRIEELLTTGRTELNKLSKTEMTIEVLKFLTEEADSLRQQNLLLESANEILAEEKQQLVTVVKELEPKAEMLNAMHGDDHGITTTTIAKELGMTAEALNNLLKDKKVQYYVKNDSKWVLTAKYQDKGYTVDKPHKYFDKQGIERVQLRMLWTGPGRIFIHKLINPRLNAA